MPMKSMLTAAVALLALTACSGTETAAVPKGEPIAKVAAPAGQSWSEMVSRTAVGGYKMGNPDAKLQLIEYGAITCPSCAAFANESAEELKKIVDTGVVAMEFRPFLVHGVQDIPGFLLAQCSGPDAFFPLTEALFADQANWLGKMGTISEAEQQAAAKMAPPEVANFLANKLGLIEFVQQRGISADQAKTCLTDAKAIDGLIKLTEQAGKDGVSGTPYFTLNGAPLDVGAWTQVKSKLVEAGAR
jgi:protein-disulfide isomerase